MASPITPLLISEPSSIVSNVDPNGIGPVILPYNSTLVQWERPKVLHHLHLDLTPIVLEFPRIDDEQGYELRYELTTDNVFAPVESIIKIKVRGQEQTIELAEMAMQWARQKKEYLDDD